jgi:hypothetical protein
VIVGHLGVAAALARWRPRVSLYWLLPAAIAPDLLDLAYAAVGFCSPYGLYSHTIPAALLLGASLGGIAVLASGRETGALVLLAVLLHLPPDWVTGWKLVWPGGALHGLRLYDHPLLDFAVESMLVAAGWALLRGRGDRPPRWAVAAWTVVGMVALQGGVDLVREGIKPSGCRPAMTAAR